MKTPIYFYLPPLSTPDVIPSTLDGIDGGEWAALCEKDRSACSWTLQTYLRLHASGFPCQLVHTLPDRGIIVVFRGNLPFYVKPNAEQLFVCCVADAHPHPYAQLQVVQNPAQESAKLNYHFIPYWVQAGLIPRNLNRGDRFETVAYYGCPANLAPELNHPDWGEQLKQLGLKWQIIEPQRWHDYSDVDAVVAVRSFKQNEYHYKPATKLFQAWHAGVPAILPPESAYRSERTSDLDYLEVNSVEDIINALKLLQINSTLRQAIVNNCRLRALETTSDQLTEKWKNFLMQVAIPRWQTWCCKPTWQKQMFMLDRFVQIKKDGLQQKFPLLRSLT